MKNIIAEKWCAALCIGCVIGITFVFVQCSLKSDTPVTAIDGSVWERVNEPGFGDKENVAVVAMKEFQNKLYALVRNDSEGAEVWRMDDTGWEQVLFPGGETNGIYGNHMINTHIGAMIVFRDKLYFAFSSGIQGSYLKSSGAEIWHYDGSIWEPVISDKKDTEDAGTISAIAGCENEDSDLTASITDAGKSWEVDQWDGGVLQITSGDGRFRRFDIISNSADTLIVQQNEIAGERGTEYTICESTHYKNPFPFHEYDLGQVSEGDSYEIGTGADENGFGNYFNKAISNFTIYDNKLYASTVLNYDYGGQVWFASDGDNWTVTQPPSSFGLFHTDENYPDDKKPVTRGIPSLCACDVSGREELYGGTLGSSGELGSCARMARLTDEGWELIVDAGVDENDIGTNENGFGDGMECSMFNGNFIVWSQACFDGKLFAGFQSLAGARVLYTPNGSSEDGSWFYSVGGDGDLPEGFDGVINAGTPDGIYQTVAVNLYPFKGYLYAGLIRLYMPEFGATESYLTGSHIWKTSDGQNWEKVTDNGLNDRTVLTFEAFSTFGDELYVSASRASNTVGGGLGGAKIYRRLDPSADSDR